MVFELLPEEVDSTEDMLVAVSLITSPNSNTTVHSIQKPQSSCPETEIMNMNLYLIQEKSD